MNAGINTVVCIVVVIVATEPAPDCDATAEIRDVPYQRRAQLNCRRRVTDDTYWRRVIGGEPKRTHAG